MLQFCRISTYAAPWCPYDPQYLNPVYDANSNSASSTADSLHPNDVGYEAMAATIPLTGHDPVISAP
jgi:lysophospholipase L1-like esterase